jgi:hypothetical protein
MRLYSGTSKQFITDAVKNQIADKLGNAFFQYYRRKPSIGEFHSWQNSLTALSNLFQFAGLVDNGIMLEYELPLTSLRLDCIICGRDSQAEDRAVIIELKQWSDTEPTDLENEVLTYVAGRKREVLHPSVQVSRYKNFLADQHTAFYEEDHIKLDAIAYLHNYSYKASDAIFDEKFKKSLDDCPIFTADESDSIIAYLKERLDEGEGETVLKRIEGSEYRPSKKLMEHVSKMIKEKSEYVLLDDQLVVYDKILTLVKNSFHDKDKHVVIVKGGPGTGKSVIAINVMADLLNQGFNAQYATGSRAFTSTLRKIIGTKGSVQFKYFNSYMKAEANQIDIIISDEAHRIRKSSNNRYTKKTDRSEKPQIHELLNAARVSVFFIDDKQIVRPDEIGSVNYIKVTAEEFSYQVHEYELTTQFRCGGSEGFVNWVDNTLEVSETANVMLDTSEEFEFKIFSDPLSLEKAIKSKAGEGYTARLTAGFCWPWSMPDQDGNLLNDVKIGDFQRPWDAKPGAAKLAKGIPKSELWAYDPSGIEQIGVVYTAQGFEFDYVGVIVGLDLKYDLSTQTWVGDPTQSADSVVKRSKENFINLVKNTYRVLLTRGMKGCYVYFMDKDTEIFFRTRMSK